MGKQEAKVEAYLNQEVRRRGGYTRKWISTVRGVPDRICIFPNGNILFIEVKTVDGKLTRRQKRELQMLRDHGCAAEVVYGVGGVKRLMEAVDKAMKGEL